MPPIEVNIDFSALAQLIVNAIVEGIRNLVSPLPMSFTEWVLRGVQSILTMQGANNVLTHVPLEWTSQHGEVVALWRESLKAQVGLSAVVLAVQGYRIMHGRIDLLEAVFRTGFFMIVGLSTVFWVGQVLNILNLAADAVGSTPLVIDAEHLPNDLVLGIMLIIAGFLAALAWIKGAVGVVFVAVLIVSGPFLLTLSALPIFEGLGKWWVEEFTTWALRGFMVALVLRLGLGIGVIHGGGFQMLFAIVAFWLAWTMDTRIRRFSVGAWGSISQMSMFSRGAAWAASAFGGAPAAAPAAVASAATP